jgi:phage shock protein PspC (stress-responsive transcriptional regulator)
MMQTSQPSLIARDHTLLGVCEAIGEDFGFNPMFLRVPFAALLLLSPIAVIGTYLALGVVVFLTRRISPNPRPAAKAPPAVAAGPAAAANEGAEEMAVAA